VTFAAAIALAACDDDSEPVPEEAEQTPLEAYVERFRRDNPYADHTIPRDGYHLAAREFAADGTTSGPTIVLLHGYPDSQHLYDGVVPHLRRNRRVLTFDFLGWGASDKPSPSEHSYDASSLRRDLEAVVSYFGDTEVVVVVHDASGWPGIDWSLDNPDRVAALVILNTVYHPTEDGIPPEGLAQFAGPAERREELVQRMSSDDTLWLDGSQSEGIIGYRDQIGRFFASAEARASLLPVLEEESLAMRPAFFALASVLFQEIAARAEDIPRMGAFTRPVTIAFGTDDPYLNLGVAADFAERFPTSERRDIPGANHYVQLDQPAAVAEAILSAGRN
jgi:pimeloyl-ACP methyl ester carboxylesterase